MANIVKCVLEDLSKLLIMISLCLNLSPSSSHGLNEILPIGGLKSKAPDGVRSFFWNRVLDHKIKRLGSSSSEPLPTLQRHG